MNIENTKQLVTHFPILYGAHNPDTEEDNIPSFYFECEDGWYSIIYDLSEAIEEYNNLNPNEIVHAVQVKEKFGSLRFYVDEAPREIYNIIDDTEAKSHKICELCGEPGEIKNIRGWLRCCCPEHSKKHKES